MVVGEIILAAFLQVVFDKLASALLAKFARQEGSRLKELNKTVLIVQVVVGDAEEKQIKDVKKMLLEDLKEVEECENKFKVNKDVQKRLQIYGCNELDEYEGPSFWDLILNQFSDTSVRIFLGAAIISFLLAWFGGGEMEDVDGLTAFLGPLVIFLILIFNTLVGVWQERNAQKELEALKKILSEQAAVIRDNKRIPNLPAKELVPGDIVELKVGDKVFAGATVVNGNCISLVTQTGMGKVHRQIHGKDTPLKKKLKEFGEVLTKIIGVMCVLVWIINVKHYFTWEYHNGYPKNFEFLFEECIYYFEIAVALAVAAIPKGLPAVITTCLALGTRKMAQKNALVRKLPSVETLGCTTVICSAKTGTLTTNQMAVAKLVAMGITSGRLRNFKVDGATYNPIDGKIHDWPVGDMDANLQMIAKIAAVCNDAGVTQFENKYIASGMPTEAALKVLVEKMGQLKESDDQICSSCSDLLRYCRKLNQTERRIATLEFDCERKSMGVIVNSLTEKRSLLVKGAVENVLERSNSIQLLDGSVVELDQNSRNLILQSLHEMSTDALRCLGFAYKDELPEFATYDGDKDHPAHELLLKPSNYSSIESKLIFVGLVGLRDPPREEVHKAIEDCKAAGIRVMVITGDYKNTAEAICREIGVFEPEEDITLKSLTCKEFMDLDDLKAHLRQGGGLLFSRAEPKHKQEIVRLLKEDGEVVAMTGGGVNDAPALKLADIGIAMGITGTEVAKEASDMVLVDNNFSTIVAAVGEGRSIYNNMKAFTRYMISNIGKVVSIVLTAGLGIPKGLIPFQLLWVNLVTDGPLATALGFHPPDRGVMKKPPHRSDESLVTAWTLFRYLVIGLYVGIATVGIFIIWYTRDSFLGIDLRGDGHTLVTHSQLGNWDQCSSWENFTVSPFTAGTQVFSFYDDPCDYFQQGKIKATTLSLSVLVAIEMFNSLNVLSEDSILLTMPPWANPCLLLAVSVSFSLHFLILYVPILAQVFGIVPLGFNEWFLVLVIAFPVILIDETLKFVGSCSSRFSISCTRQSLKPKLE